MPDSTISPIHASVRHDRAPSVRLSSDSLHELASPVNQIGAMVDLIRRRHRASMDEDAATLFEFLQTASERLQTLLSGMREYMRLAAKEDSCVHFDARELVGGLLAGMRRNLEEHSVRVTCAELPVIYGDPCLIGHLFTNLIENAIRFRSAAKPEVHISAQRVDAAWLFSVRDNGIGIEPKNHDRIFEVFRRVSNSGGGSGVGLAIADHIVERHRGTIWVESRLGQGAAFLFTLPDPPEGHDPGNYS
jgi:chemotaxis family two-component system sensor kinase Cph1